MKYYDYKKAKSLIEANKNEITEASLGMHEDWWWTAETVWDNGEYKHALPDNAVELQDEYINARKKGLSFFAKEKDDNGGMKPNPEMDNFQKNMIAGLFGSSWATPTLELKFKDDSNKMIPCFTGESDETPHSDFLGCISSEVQANITPLQES